MNISIEKITPARARQFLELNKMNRTVREDRVEQFARLMRHGKFIGESGETIKFNGEDLIDGQHRLLAIVKTDLTQTLAVARGISEEARMVIDTPSVRLTSDWFHMNGISDSKALGAAVTIVWRAWNGYPVAHGGSTHASPTTPEANEILERFPGIADSVRIASKSKEFLSTGRGGGMHFLFSVADAKKANEFFGLLASGKHESDKEPAWLLRERLAANRASKTKMRMGDMFALVIKAWNLFYRDQETSLLRFASKVEEFPPIAGLLVEQWKAGAR